ncbi:MAG: 6-phosphofructokinase [Anaerolineales bacterium]|nr:6-phosphofructokinase [Anaerolineales bacterium]MCB8939871.1 6-phosphofructokinase [Ardenticatenaceae bacterium]
MKRIGVLTSGGDAQGMNAAVRAVVRMALNQNMAVYAIYEGYQGMVNGGDQIRPFTWTDVGGILQQGGTVIGTARCAEFRERSGRLKAARNLLLNGIDSLVIIGGDGSLTGANYLYEEWPGLLEELVATGQIAPDVAAKHAHLQIAGIIGSIDNDMYGSDVTTGSDTALHRIVEATDAISSTAASHQRIFVVEVMGRRCGYLALMGAMAGGADWVFIPENPPDIDDWEEKMCKVLHLGREAGRRDIIVVVAEGAQDRYGQPITSERVKHVLEDRLGEETRITVLGHVQRGGAPSAFDRNLSTLLGAAAVEHLLAATEPEKPFVIGIRGNKITRTPLDEALAKTQAVAQASQEQHYAEAMRLRGNSFNESFQIVRTMVRVLPHPPTPGQRRLRLAVLNAGGPAPGMNTAVRTAVRLATDKGHIMLGVQNGFRGLLKGDIREMDWMSVSGWASRGGAELGTNRLVPEGSDFYAIARSLEEHKIDGLIMIGGWSGYESVLQMMAQRATFPANNIPMVCVPASINNNLPGAELSIGADTALNNIVQAVDKIKQSAVASRRVFVVEVMGHNCGYLALMSALATGAERVYTNEEGITTQNLLEDVHELSEGFSKGKRLGLVIRSENANPIYTTSFISALYEEEGGDLFDVREAILGHLQQGGDPSPFDRILATRLASHAVNHLEGLIEAGETTCACLGQVGGALVFTDMQDVPRMFDMDKKRPKKQWWMDLQPIAKILAKPAPH